MNKIRTLVIDDEPLARRGVRHLLKSEPDIEILGECGDGLQAVEEITAQTPDLILLDIQMPEMDGFAVLQALTAGRPPLVIFITAYDEFALHAFQAHALDYLLKPIKPHLFKVALDRVRAVLQFQQTRAFEQKLEALLQHLPGSKRYVERLMVRTAGGMQILPVHEIDWFEAEGDYVRIHKGGKKYLLRERMNGLEARLNPQKFLRIHRSAIVNIDRIHAMQPRTNGDYAVILTSGAQLTLSRTYREKVFAILQQPL